MYQYEFPNGSFQRHQMYYMFFVSAFTIFSLLVIYFLTLSMCADDGRDNLHLKDYLTCDAIQVLTMTYIALMGTSLAATGAILIFLLEELTSR